MLNIDLKGPIAPVLTPFKENCEIDIDTLELFINWLIKQKISALFPIGSSGERDTLSFDEKKLIIKVINEIVQKKVPVYPGTGCDSLKETLELSEFAFKEGSDAVFIVIPKEIKPSEDEIFLYFKEIDIILNKPFFIYEPQGYEPYSITPNLFRRLLDLPNFIGMKDSSYNMLKIIKNLMLLDKRDICIIQGNELLYLSSLPLGINVVIGGGCNIYPSLFIRLYDKFIKGDIESARDYQWIINKNWEILENGWPLSGKIFLAMKGIPFKPICRVKVNINKINQEDIEKLKIIIDE